jgi:hypothetical protein
MTERFIVAYKESNGLMCIGICDTERNIWSALTPNDSQEMRKRLESMRDRLNAEYRKEMEK